MTMLSQTKTVTLKDLRQHLADTGSVYPESGWNPWTKSAFSTDYLAAREWRRLSNELIKFRSMLSCKLKEVEARETHCLLRWYLGRHPLLPWQWLAPSGATDSRLPPGRGQQFVILRCRGKKGGSWAAVTPDLCEVWPGLPVQIKRLMRLPTAASSWSGQLVPALRQSPVVMMNNAPYYSMEVYG